MSSTSLLSILSNLEDHKSRLNGWLKYFEPEDRDPGQAVDDLLSEMSLFNSQLTHTANNNNNGLKITILKDSAGWKSTKAQMEELKFAQPLQDLIQDYLRTTQPKSPKKPKATSKKKSSTDKDPSNCPGDCELSKFCDSPLHGLSSSKKPSKLAFPPLDGILDKFILSEDVSCLSEMCPCPGTHFEELDRFMSQLNSLCMSRIAQSYDKIDALCNSIKSKVWTHFTTKRKRRHDAQMFERSSSQSSLSLGPPEAKKISPNAYRVPLASASTSSGEVTRKPLLPPITATEEENQKAQKELEHHCTFLCGRRDKLKVELEKCEAEIVSVQSEVTLLKSRIVDTKPPAIASFSLAPGLRDFLVGVAPSLNQLVLAEIADILAKQSLDVNTLQKWSQNKEKWQSMSKKLDLNIGQDIAWFELFPLLATDDVEVARMANE